MKILKYSILAILIVALGSCDSFLDTLPDNRGDLDSEEKAYKMLVAAYPGYSEVYMNEMMSDNTSNHNWNLNSNTEQELMYYWKDIVETGANTPASLWPGCYMAIANANLVLDYIESLGTPKSLLGAKGEALVCRAYAHYVLVSTFCMPYGKNNDSHLGVHYMTEMETEVAPLYKRGTLQETYDKIGEDLEIGIPLIDDSKFKQAKYHFNKKAAYAFAAQFNLIRGEFEQTIKYSNLLLGENAASRLRNWTFYASLSVNGIVQPNQYMKTTEIATLLISLPISSWSVASGPYTSLNKYGHGNAVSKQESIEARGPWGGLSNLHIKLFANDAVNKMIFRKVGYYFEYTDPVAGIGYGHSSRVHFTTDETLLCRAEAYILSGQLQRGFDDISTFMNAFAKKTPSYAEALSFYADKDAASGTGLAYDEEMAPSPKKSLEPPLYQITSKEQETLLHYLLHVRRMLTLHEGQRWHDIKRYGITIYRRTFDRTEGIVEVEDVLRPGDPRLAIQLPKDAITAGIEKNPR